MNRSNPKWKPGLYNEKHSFVYAFGESLLDLLDPKEHERILDLGCGSGQLTSRIKESSKDTLGLDKSPEMIEDARSKYKDIDFQIGDAENFHFDQKFDSIFSNATLHWVKNYKKAILCMFENLKPNGKIVLEFGGKGNVETIVDQLRKALRQRGYLQQAELDLWYFPSIGEYATQLEAAGFRVVHAEHYDRPTKLADEKNGIKDWILMFAESFFKNVSPDDVVDIKNEVQEKVRGKCFIHDSWFADYKRIRIVAVKEGSQ